MLALTTYMGHAKVASTYWYLESTPELMVDIAQRCLRDSRRVFLPQLTLNEERADHAVRGVIEDAADKRV